MAQRYTSKDAKVCFERLCELFNKSDVCYTKNEATGNYTCNVGAWCLDHNSVYGGYVVHEMHNSSGGVSTPFGDSRRNAREFCQMVWDIEKAQLINKGM